MRLCMVTTFYSPYHFGGDGIFVRSLARALVSQGHHVDVVHCEDAYRLRCREQPADQTDHDGIVVHRLRSPFGLLSPLLTQQTGRPGLKARELDAILDRDFDVVNFHNISLIGYVGMVLAESMRLYPPTWIFVRMVRGEDTLPSGVTVPARSKLYLCQYVMQRDPRFFPDPERFDPDRFSENARKVRPQFSYFPFGGGPRVCIGEHFAKMEAMLVLSMIAQRFGVHLSPGQTIVPEPKMTLRPKHGIMMTVRHRHLVEQRDHAG